MLTDFVCLYNYEFWLSLCKIVRSSVILLLPLFNLGLFTNISARWPGSTHDSHVFRTSAIGIHLQNRYRGINQGVLLGDSGYPCRPFLLTPYRQPVEIKEQRFNISHVSTRSKIERTFAIWKKRFNLMHSEVLWQAIFIYESIQKMRHFYGKG